MDLLFEAELPLTEASLELLLNVVMINEFLVCKRVVTFVPLMAMARNQSLKGTEVRRMT